MSSNFKGDGCYACPTNRECNAIHAAILNQHVHTTHPSIDDNKMPPEHKLIIESNITSSVKARSNQRVDSYVRHCIITSCCDADAMVGTKLIDPALCIYIGAHLICIDNKHLKDKVPRDNGTLCRVLNVKLKHIAPSYKWKKNYRRKVWTVNANDVEWVEYKHVNKTGSIIQLETNINNLTYQLELAKTDNQTQKQEIQTYLENQKNKLAKIMSERKFKLGPEQFTPVLTATATCSH